MLSLLDRYTMREKAIVIAAVVIVVLLALHALIVEPYQAREAELREQIEQHREDLNWMRTAVARLPASGPSDNAAAISGTLANFIDQAVRTQGLSGQLSQMSPIGSDEIRMRYSGVDFNRLVRFIAQVNTSGLDVKDIRISAVEDPGIVDSSIVLVRR